MSIDRRRKSVLGLLLACAIPASGQTVSLADPFGSVTGTIFCHAVPVSTADSAAFLFEFIEADSLGGTRRTIAAYGPDGAPLYFTMAAMDNGSQGARRALLFAVRLVPKGLGTRMSVVGERVDSTGVYTAADSAAGLPRGARLLTLRELEQARALSVSVWQRRCGDRNEVRPVAPVDTARKAPPTGDAALDIAVIRRARTR